MPCSLECDGFYRKRVSIENLYSNEVDYTNALMLLIKIMLRSKLHYQKGFKLNPFFYKIAGGLYPPVEGLGVEVVPHRQVRPCGTRPRSHRNVQRFRGGLVFKAHRLCISLNSRLGSNKEEEKT